MSDIDQKFPIFGKEECLRILDSPVLLSDSFCFLLIEETNVRRQLFFSSLHLFLIYFKTKWLDVDEIKVPNQLRVTGKGVLKTNLSAAQIIFDLNSKDIFPFHSPQQVKTFYELGSSEFFVKPNVSESLPQIGLGNFLLGSSSFFVMGRGFINPTDNQPDYLSVQPLWNSPLFVFSAWDQIVGHIMTNKLRGKDKYDRFSTDFILSAFVAAKTVAAMRRINATVSPSCFL
jgi:hypothetical protein